MSGEQVELSRTFLAKPTMLPVHEACAEHAYTYEAYTRHIEEGMSIAVIRIFIEEKGIFLPAGLVQMTKCLYNKKCLWTCF